MTGLHGRCLCGAVAFDVHEPQMLLECHCTRCRQWTGCASTPAVVVSAANLEQTAGQDLLKRYREDGFSDRFFCAECGSSVFAGGPDTFYVNAGALEDPLLEVACHIQVANKAAWHEIGGDAPQYAEMPHATSET
jgi:hypothetical protein